MRKKRHIVIDGQNLKIESVVVGQPSQEAINHAALIIAHSYLNRRISHG